MSESIVAAAEALCESLRGFDPELYSGPDCAAIVEKLAAAEKLSSSVRVRAALRAADCGAHRAAGFADAAEWLARRSGTSFGAARAAMDTAEALESCPATAEAFAGGELSLNQAAEIAKAEVARPGSEEKLLHTARTGALHTLRDEARKVRLQAVEPEELHRRQQAAQHLRHWRDELGMTCFSGALPPEAGVPFVNILDAETDRVARELAAGGRGLSREQLAGRALCRMLKGAGKGKSRSADVVVVADLNAWRRGHVHAGEPCHIIGGGPIPVDLAKQLSQDAFLKSVIHDGVEIHTVAHHGRHIPAELRTALELGAPPDFEGVTCDEAGCGRRYGLEFDHTKPVANKGETSFNNVHPLCGGDHRKKTAADRAAGLLGGKHDGRDPP